LETRGVDDLMGTAMPRLDSAVNMRFNLSFPLRQVKYAKRINSGFDQFITHQETAILESGAHFTG